ncbi:MAG: SpoIID/LytB domain-containing protein [Chloroflexota bacterium]|nr:SpoIID/LytB domain-containing protein [Chloroflexota bacterium]
MMTRRRYLLLVPFLFILSLGPASFRRSISADSEGFAGTVVDMVTESPIPDAEVRVDGEATVTDAGGRYRLSAAPGVHEVRVRAAGYIGVTRGWCTLEKGKWAEVDFEMVPRHPDKVAAAIIDEKMMQVSQAPPPDLTNAISEKGYALSSVEQVPETIRVLMPDDSVVVMRMEEYLRGVVPAEMSPYWPPEALRAQAVAARTYAATRHAHEDKGADVCTTSHCQVWGPTHYETTDQAVEETHGVSATFDGRLIYAFFFAHCNGHTRSSKEVWGGDLPYCQPVECPCGHSELYGHGVGMCQWGARALAEEGYTYKDILKHYYTGVTVDDMPRGSVSVPEWNRSTAITLTFSHVVGAAVQLSNDWVWEGEDEELYHWVGTGRVVSDTQALNGWAWFGEGGVDSPGAWYGPYACDLPDGQDYDVYFRLKTSDNTLAEGIATLDVVDNLGEDYLVEGDRCYDERPLMGTDFAQSGRYEEFRLALNYGSVWPTCSDPDIKDGLEFRTWFNGKGDLYLDRVTVFQRPQPVSPSIVWNVREEEGPQEVIVRFWDGDGDRYDQVVVTVNVDMSAPQWLSYGSRSAEVQDALSGLDAESAVWCDSCDGGVSWSEWRTLSLTATVGITEPLRLTAPPEAEGHVRFRIQDVAGNVSESDPIALAPSPTPSATPSPTRPFTEECLMPLILKAADE